MTNVNRSRSAKRSALFAAALTISLVSPLYAQEKSWELATRLESFNSHYTETSTTKVGEPMTLTGNSWSVASLLLDGAYHARADLHAPFFLELRGLVPIFTSNGAEAGSLVRSGATFTTQKEQVRHTNYSATVRLGYEILPMLEPYLALDYDVLSSRRTGQQEGTDNGDFQPSSNQDYTETVRSSHLGFGLLGVIPLDENAAWRLRYDGGYLNAQSASVSNTYFDAGYWGQGTTGYTLHGELSLEMPFALAAGQAAHDGFIAIGARIAQRHWDGNGRVATELFLQPYWPANTITSFGAFIGTGVFF